MKNAHIAILCASLITMSAVCGCIDEGGNKKKEAYILEAIISVDKNIVYPNETITFDASNSKGDELEYYWDFDNSDGFQWVKDKTITYSYPEYGAYTATLKVVDINEGYDYEHVNIYVNYKAGYSDNITKSEGEKSYFFPLKTSAQSAVVTLEYPSNYVDYPGPAYEPNTNDLDLYIYYNESEDSEVKNSSEPLDIKATGTIEEVVELSRSDLLWNLTGMRASVKWALDCLSDSSIEYTLSIEVYYNP
jgi:hypothetical protein